MTIETLLKNQGYSYTQPRKIVFEILGHYPKTAQEIYEAVKQKDISIDLASVYRSLELFVDMGIAYVIDVGEETKRYELVDEDNHHHHLICTKCGAIEDIQLNEQKLINEANNKTNFEIHHHHLEFFGLCPSCQ